MGRLNWWKEWANSECQWARKPTAATPRPRDRLCYFYRAWVKDHGSWGVTSERVFERVRHFYADFLSICWLIGCY